MPSRDVGKPGKQAEGKGYEGGNRMAQPELVTTATTGLSGAPSLPGLGPTEPARKLRGRFPAGHKSQSSMPLAPSRRFMGLSQPKGCTRKR